MNMAQRALRGTALQTSVPPGPVIVAETHGPKSTPHVLLEVLVMLLLT
jgi:hypothetical protein